MGKTYTSNYNLTKDDENEFYNVAVQSENMELIDGALKALSDEKVSHIEGKGLSTNDYSDAEKQKLAKIPEDAIDYQHPATHSLDMITETGSRKIFSSAERTKLSGIDEGANNYTHPSSHSLDMITETTAKKIMTSAERSKLAGIETGANNYVHPSTHSLDMITETSLKKILTSTERTKLAGIETGAQANPVKTLFSYEQTVTVPGVYGSPILFTDVVTIAVPIGNAQRIQCVVSNVRTNGRANEVIGLELFREFQKAFIDIEYYNAGSVSQWEDVNLGYPATIERYSNEWSYDFAGDTSMIDSYISGTNLILKFVNIVSGDEQYTIRVEGIKEK